MPQCELLDQESLRTEDVGRLLRAHERGGRISLGTVEVSYERNIGRGCTHHISDDENRVFELGGRVGREPFN